MPPAEPSQQLPRVLLIDDDAISREVLAMMLEMHGFPVDSAEDGKQALELLDDAATLPGALPGIVLMDTQMPGVSGLRLIKALRQRLKSAAHNASRIVAISGSEVSDSILQAADGFLLKPIQVESLLALLEPERALSAAPAPSIEASADPNARDVAEFKALLEPAILDPAILDPVVLGKLKAMMPPAALKEVYSALAADLEARLPTLAAAIDAGRATEVARIAHTIKGGCSMVGLSCATEAAARLEGSNRPDTWPRELLQLHFALGKLQDILGNGLL